MGQVKTPMVFTEWAERTGTDVVMVPADVPPNGLSDALNFIRASQSCVGAVVTFPHKQAVAEALDEATEAVSVTGACNVLRREADGRLSGGMTDGLGFVSALKANGHDLASMDARLVGTGGAGSAIALALLDAGVSRLVIGDIDQVRLSALVTRLAKMRSDAGIYTEEPADFDCGLICNASPVGMSGDPNHPWPLSSLPKTCIVADIVPDPPDTPWVTQARASGHPVQTGPEMVKAQLPALLAHLFPDLQKGDTC